MDPARIAELLEPFLGPAKDQRLTPSDLLNISTYIDLLLRWNAHINLTAIRHPEEIVIRHFGESLFAARHLVPAFTHTLSVSAHPAADAGVRPSEQIADPPLRLIDVGSGAGFPGLPIKIWRPRIELTLIESNQKKATFLREVARKLTLTNVHVCHGRAENYAKPRADVVTLRAVERFSSALPIAARLVAPGGRLALLIGDAQLPTTRELTPEFIWSPPVPVPRSSSRVLVTGIRMS
jgi:16S rRNA (guanine527-N7)-methyltransferase